MPLRFGSSAGRWVIAGTVLGSGMAAIDATVVGIALPSIGRQFHASFGALQWVVIGYTLTLASLLLIGGSLGDRYGHRRMFAVGVVWFTAASAACALTPNITGLVATRLLQGAGAAMLTPGSLAILQASFDPSDRGRAIGAWSGLGGVATAVGPLLGGYLVAAASWRWIFFINLPIGALVLFVSVRHIPESRDQTTPSRLDLAGSVLATAALAGITFACVEGPIRGWSDPAVLALLLTGTVAGLGFLVVERRSVSPVLPLEMFRSRQFTVTNVVTFIVYGALGGTLFLLPIQLQVVDHDTPLESGLALMPLTLIMLLLSARSGRLATRIGPRLQMSVGPVVVGTGLALLARTTTDTSYASGTLPAVIVFGLGLAITVAPLTATALAAAPLERAGVASATNNAVARTGGLLAVALLPALAGISHQSYLRPDDFSSGFRTAVLVAAAWCIIGGLVSALGIRNSARSAPSAPDPCSHCALDATPLAPSTASSAG